MGMTHGNGKLLLSPLEHGIGNSEIAAHLDLATLYRPVSPESDAMATLCIRYTVDLKTLSSSRPQDQVGTQPHTYMQYSVV